MNFFGKKDKKIGFLGQYEPCFALFKKSNTQNAVMNENRFYIFACILYAVLWVVDNTELNYTYFTKPIN